MDEFDVRWRELTRRRNLALFAFLGYVPITLTFGLLAHKLFQSEIPVFVFAWGWMLFFAVAVIRCNAFRCPRCGGWFFSSWLWFARRCAHCKLGLYGTKEQAIGQS